MYPPGFFLLLFTSLIYSSFLLLAFEWCDGSPNEFTSEPEPIDEEKALYHLYTKNGILEITGTMIRTKHNKYGTEQVGLAKVKNFTLKKLDLLLV